MPRLEGNFAIYPTDDGLLVLVPDPADEKVTYYFGDDSPGYAVTREMEGYLTLRNAAEDPTFHLSRTENASKLPCGNRKVQ